MSIYYACRCDALADNAERFETALTAHADATGRYRRNRLTPDILRTRNARKAARDGVDACGVRADDSAYIFAFCRA